jgi:hypothetical protein
MSAMNAKAARRSISFFEPWERPRPRADRSMQALRRLRIPPGFIIEPHLDAYGTSLS